jgi:hypothetical protein
MLGATRAVKGKHGSSEADLHLHFSLTKMLLIETSHLGRTYHPLLPPAASRLWCQLEA